MIFNGIIDGFQFALTPSCRVAPKIAEIELFLTTKNMIIHKPCARLYKRIPGISGIIAVTIVTGIIKYHLDITWDLIQFCNVRLQHPFASIFSGLNKLDGNEAEYYSHEYNSVSAHGDYFISSATLPQVGMDLPK